MSLFLPIYIKVAPKGAQKSPLGAILETFGIPVPAFWRALGHLWHTWGPTVDLVDFVGQGVPQKLAGGKARGALGTW